MGYWSDLAVEIEAPHPVLGLLYWLPWVLYVEPCRTLVSVIHAGA
jgi:hypothetical protein